MELTHTWSRAETEKVAGEFWLIQYPAGDRQFTQKKAPSDKEHPKGDPIKGKI